VLQDAKSHRARHAAEENERRKNPSAAPRAIAEGRGNEFGHQQPAGGGPEDLVLQRGIQIGLAQAEDTELAGKSKGAQRRDAADRRAACRPEGGMDPRVANPAP